MMLDAATRERMMRAMTWLFSSMKINGPAWKPRVNKGVAAGMNSTKVMRTRLATTP